MRYYHLRFLWIALLAGLLHACTSVKTPSPFPTLLPTLPQHTLAINPDNAAKVAELARYGAGVLRDILWTPDRQTVRFITADGIYDYSVPDFKQVNFQELLLGTGASAVSRDGSLAVSVVNVREINHPDGTFDAWDTLRMWNVAANQLLWEQEIGVWNSVLAISPDRKLLAAGGWKATADGGRVQVWDAHLGKLVMQIEDDRTWSVDELAFSPDGRFLAAGGRNDSQEATLFRVWDIPTQTLLYSWEGKGQTIAFGTDGKTITLGTDRWDLATGKALKPADNKSFIAEVISPDGHWKASGCTKPGESAFPSPSRICLWDLEREKVKWQASSAWSPTSILAFSPDSRELVIYGDQEIQLWEVATGKLMGVLDWNGNYVSDLTISPTGYVAAWIDGGNSLQIWDLAQGKRLPAKAGYGGAIAYSPAGLLAVGSYDQLMLWDEAGTNLIRELPGQSHPDDGLSFSPDGNLLVGVNNGYDVTVWDIPAGKIKASLVGHTSSVISADFSHDGRFFATASDDATIRLWDSQALTCMRILTTGSGLDYYAFSVAISPDSQYVAGGTSDGKVWLWRASDGYLVRQFGGHTDGVLDLAFSPDGQLLASAGDDSRIYLWNVSTGEALQILAQHTSSVKTLAFTPDGRWLLSGSEDGTVRVWGIED
jgi:WD40 repeat protein